MVPQIEASKQFTWASGRGLIVSLFHFDSGGLRSDLLTRTSFGLLGGSGSLSEKSQSRGATATSGRGPPGSWSKGREAVKRSKEINFVN